MAKAVTLANDVDSVMPGSMAIPFGFKIRAGTYPETGHDPVWTYFCAPLDRATASFPGLGVVVRGGDCIGVRKRRADGRLEWVVDNSVYNHMNTVWSRSVKVAETADLSFAPAKVVTDASVDKQVTFDGFYSGLLNFTFPMVPRSER